jgi:dihydrofolate synthase/folylpolyglutamate synthase
MQAVSVLAANLKAMGSLHKQTFAVFGAMRDKQLAPMVERMRRLVDHWYLCALPTERAAQLDELEALMADAPHSAHTSPRAALQAALAAAGPADRIVVFGSFHTVGGVLKDGLPRLSAPHLGPPG